MENTVRIIEQNYRKNKYVKYKNIYVTSVNWIFCSNIHNFFVFYATEHFNGCEMLLRQNMQSEQVSFGFRKLLKSTTSLIKNILWWWHANKKYLWLPAWDRGGSQVDENE